MMAGQPVRDSEEWGKVHDDLQRLLLGRNQGKGDGKASYSVRNSTVKHPDLNSAVRAAALASGWRPEWTDTQTWEALIAVVDAGEAVPDFGDPRALYLYCAKVLLNRIEMPKDENVPLPGANDGMTLAKLRLTGTEVSKSASFESAVNVRKAYVAWLLGYASVGSIAYDKPAMRMIADAVLEALLAHVSRLEAPRKTQQPVDQTHQEDDRAIADIKRYIEPNGTDAAAVPASGHKSEHGGAAPYDDGLIGAEPATQPARPTAATKLQRIAKLSTDLEVTISIGFSQGEDYVRRRAQDRLMAALFDGSVETGIHIVTGDPGSGKSSLLWGLSQELRNEHMVLPILLSAAWFLRSGDFDALVEGAELRDALQGVEATVLLLDTADLLLHDDRSVAVLVELLRAVNASGLPIVIATRPAEAERLPADLGPRTSLGPYSRDGELPLAVERLSARFCPDVDPTRNIDIVSSAVIRNLPSADLCRSPLMLRMLFEVASPEAPDIDTDATGLYERYWRHRVVADRSSGRDTEESRRDLSVPVGNLGVRMLAIGSPDLSDAELEMRPDDLAVDALELMHHRGLTVRADGFTSFFHQTWFEFAAAKRMVASARAEESLSALEEVVTASPGDLLRGAVLEQALALFGRVRPYRAAVSNAIRRLCASEDPTLQGLGLRSVAHNRVAVIGADATELAVALRSAPAAVVRDFLRTLLRVKDLDVDATSRLVTEVWKREDSRLCLEIVRVLSVLYARHKEFGSWFVVNECVGYFAANHREGLKSPDFLTVVGQLARSTDPLVRSYAQVAIEQAIHELAAEAGRSVIIGLLHIAADNWATLGDEAYAVRLVTAVERAQSKRRRPRHRDVRAALAAVIGAELRRRAQQGTRIDWTAEATRARRMCEERPWAAEPGALLTAIAARLREEGKGSVLVDGIVETLMTVDDGQAVWQLAQTFVIPVLQTETYAGDLVEERLLVWLEALPVAPNSADGLPAIRALVARSVLADEALPAWRLQRLCARIGPPASADGWRTIDNLAEVLPVAAAAGVRGAEWTMARITQGLADLGPAERTALLHACNESVRLLAAHADAFVRVATESGSVTELSRALTVGPRGDDGRDELEERSSILRPHAEALLAVATNGLAGKDNRQAEGAVLLDKLLRTGVATLPWDQLRRLQRAVSHPTARELLVKASPLACAGESRVLDGLLEDVAVGPERMVWRGRRGQSFANHVQDAYRTALLQLLAREVDPQRLPVLEDLCHMPKPGTATSLDVIGFNYAGQMIAAVARAGHLAAALQTFVSISTRLMDLSYSTKQRRDASHGLVRALESMILAGEGEAVPVLLEALRAMPKTLGIFVVQTVCQLAFARYQEQLARLLTSQGLDPDVRAELERQGRRRGANDGGRQFAEIYELI